MNYFISSRHTAFFLLCILGNLMKFSKAVQTFRLGGLFHEDSGDIEFAFKYAINFYNLRDGNDFFFEPHIRHVPKQDVFATSKVVCEMIEEDGKLVAIFGPPAARVAQIVRSTCSKFQIPNVQTYWTGYYPPSNTSINLHPDWQILVEGLATIIRHLHWNTYVVLYENDESLMRLQGVMKDPDQHLILKQLSYNKNDRVLLKEIKQMKHKAIIIECSQERTLEVLAQAQEIGLTKDYSYFLSSLDAHNIEIDGIGFDQDNITAVRVVDPTNSHLADVLQHWNAQQMWSKIFADKFRFDVALMHDAVIFFATAFANFHAHHEINPGEIHCKSHSKWEEGLEIGGYLQEHSIANGLTGDIKLNGNTRSSLTLQVIRIMKKEKHALGYWTSTNPKEYYYLRSDAELNREISEQYHGRTLIVSSRIGRPYLMHKSNATGLRGNDQFEGYSLDLIDHISKIVNFTYEFRLAADGKYGNYVPTNKSWNGLIRDLLDGTADLAICDLTITHERRAVVDFTMPFMTLGISILHIKPNPKERNIFAFMDPIDTVVWIYIVTAYISVTLILYAITRMAPGDWESTDPLAENPDELENIWDIKNCFWLTLGSTMSQGCDILPKGVSSRMATSLWWFFILIISSSYTANLAAFLTTDRMGPAINNAEALAKQTKIKYGTMADGSTQAFFRNSNYSTYKRMWTQMEQAKPSVFENTNADGVKRVKTTKNQLYAFLMESSSIEYEIARDCELKQVGGQLDSKGYGIALQLNSPLRKQINNAILELQEDGKLLALKVKWWKEMYGGSACNEEKSEEPSSSLELALSNVGGVFVVIGIGLGIAFLISIVEFFGNIYTVSVQDHKSCCIVATNELKFALQLWIVKKDAATVASDTDVSSDSSENSNSQNNI